jgi:hypothetical protein
VPLHRASIARELEPGGHRLGGRCPEADDRLGVEAEGELGVGVPEQGLGGLDVDALGHQARGVGPAQIVEHEPDVPRPAGGLVGQELSQARGDRGRVPDPAQPVRVPQDAPVRAGDERRSAEAW